MIAFSKTERPLIRLREPIETLIVPSRSERIEVEEGPEGELLRMIVYTRVQSRPKVRRGFFSWRRR